MSIRITLPSGILIEADTLSETLAVAKAFSPHETEVLPAEPGPRARTLRRATNGDLAVLDAWGLNDQEIYDTMGADDWKRLSGELNRSTEAVRSLARRYIQGVYESSGSDPAAKVKVHGEKDLSRVSPA